jgi:hypothetical protein
MALINYEIPTRSFELIRDRIAQIAADELARQAAITYEDLFMLQVYTQRNKPFNPDEQRMVNVTCESGKYDNHTAIDSDGEFIFYIDVFGTGSYNDTDNGDKVASFETQRIAGVLQGIFADPQYLTLGFARPFIMRSKITGFEPGTIERNDSANIAVCRTTLVVKASQSEVTQPVIDNFETSTQVFLYETELGYLYSGVGAPLPPPSPTCEPVEIYDSAGNLLGTKESGGTFIVSNAIARLINTLSEEISQTEILAEATGDITAPNATYRVLNLAGAVLASGSIPSNKAQDITINISTYTYSITDSAGGVLYSGNITENLIKAIQDCNIENSNGSYTASILAEDGLVLPDVTINAVNSNLDVIASDTIPSVIDGSLNIPDTTLNINKTGGGLISSEVIPSGTTGNYTVADSTVVIKNSAGTTLKTETVKATESKNSTLNDISFTDSNGTISSVPAGVDIVATACATPTPRSTAKLMQTGQTTVYRTGDDASNSSSAGRASSFFVLDSAPIHNDGSATINTTTNRFTGTSGGATYPNTIMIDWSTFDGSTVLGYYYGDINGTNRSWNDAIDWGLALSVGSFTSGWRLANASELHNLICWESAYAFHYTPLNSYGFLTVGFWSSTTWKGLTSYAMRIVNSDHTLAPIGKTNTMRCIACRTFTVTGTTLS